MKALRHALRGLLAFCTSVLMSVDTTAMEVITAPGVTNTTGAGNTFAPVLSDDGRYVAFLSQANNLVTNDSLLPYLDLFLRDRVSGATTLISVDQSGTGGGNGDSGYPSWSTNGRFLLFASDASNVAANDTNDVSDIFLRDVASGVTHWVSVPMITSPPSPTWNPIRGSSKPVMTPDARWIAFESTADNLVNDDTNGICDVFVRDMQMGTTQRASASARAASGRSSRFASISRDGRFVAFVSSAINLIPGRTNTTDEIYARDLQNGVTIWASSNLMGYFNLVSNTYWCSSPIMSPEGEHVAFKGGTNSSEAHLFYHDLESGATSVLATNSRADTLPAFGDDGRWVAFEENGNVLLRDLANGTNVLVSVNLTGGLSTNGVSFRPVITPDARYVAFVSYASDLVAGFSPMETNVARIYVRDVLAGVTRLVSIATNGGPSAFQMESALPALTPDGQSVAFDSDASDLVSDDLNDASDVFIRDIAAQRTELISMVHALRAPRSGLQSASLGVVSLSSNGQRIAFQSFDDPRVSFDTNGQRDVFVQDLVAGTALAASVPRLSTPTNGAAFDPIISANGEAIIFRQTVYLGMYLWDYRNALFWKSLNEGPAIEVDSRWDDNPGRLVRFYAGLSPDGATALYTFNSHLHWKNMITGQTGRVTQTWNNYNPEGPSSSPTFSHNGRFVAFASSAGWLVSNVYYYGHHMYVRDMELNATRLLSRENATGQALPASQVMGGIFSGNDRYVVFDGVFTTNQQKRVYQFDLESGLNGGTLRLVCTNCSDPSVSENGQWVAYAMGLYPTVRTNVALADLSSGETRLLGRDVYGSAVLNAIFSAPDMRGDGRFVVFATTAPSLVAHDTNRFSDVFVYDRVQRTTTLISRSLFGVQAAARGSSRPMMAADGRTVVFQSFASDLVEGDYNDRGDIFVVKLGLGDADNDGMDDDWEVAYFGNLNRNGAGDQDGDGQSDLQEFLAGTDPTNGGSILRVLTVTPMAGGSTTVVWSAVVGRSYVVQYKDSLDAAIWSNASAVISANSTSMAFNHNSASAQRYYRVVAVQ
jgi:Tol biopolymer transport system component